MKYTKFPLEGYVPDRHLELGKMYSLVSNENLPVDKINDAISSGELQVYHFKDVQYLDRLDVGRVYHEEPENKKGLSVEKYFTDKVSDIKNSAGAWGIRHLEIKNYQTDEVVFSLDAEFPVSWNDTNASIVAQKYFFKPRKEEWKKKLTEKIGVDHENSLFHLSTRVANYLAEEGSKLGYFATEEDKNNFRDEILYLQVNQKFAFNSPVQFNAGLFNEYGVEGNKSPNFYKDPKTGLISVEDFGEYEHPQCHACFIAGPQDDLEKISQHYGDESRVFSLGSGIGQNIGILRGQGEPLSGGGKSSGSISFFKNFDYNAGAIKSGGKSRRAARMTQMRQNHPDILEFIRTKVREDHKALILMQNGYSSGMDGEAYTTVALQNTNLSVRLNDYFFEQVRHGGKIDLVNVTDGKVIGNVSAEQLLKEMAFGSWRIGDPGAMYETMIDLMHTCPNSARQNASNPCAEYLFIDDTSCNLASLNLLSFCDENGNFAVRDFVRAAKIIQLALDINNSAASYPIRRIAEISPEFRTTGLGYANMGGFLMRKGLAYDSDEGRAWASAITALMTGSAYEASSEMAEKLGTFTHFEFNKKPMMKVMERHKNSLENIVWDHIPSEIKNSVYSSWSNVLEKGEKNGFRNAQATVIAPTGTISYLMGSQDFTGIEPAISLTIQKNLAGGGNITLANQEVENALKNLNYSPNQIKDISEFIAKRNVAIGAPHLNPDHYAIFATAFGNANGEGNIPIEGHLKMMAAAQPFVSGGISKTNNFPESATVRDVYEGFIMAHDLGLKGLTFFRNNSKPISALSFGNRGFQILKRGEREDLPAKRPAAEFETTIFTEHGEVPFHMIVSEYKDGRPGQITFLSYKAGSTLGAFLNNAGIQASRSLKRGVSLEDVATGWLGHEFDPKGMVKGYPFVKVTTSPLDLAGKILLIEYMGKTEFATEPEKVNLVDLQGFQNGAFRTYRRMKVNDWDFNSVMKDPELGGFVNGENLELIGNSHNGKMNNSRGVTCKACGNPMRQTAPNCFSCERCGDKVGGCGL